ncbi:MAG TPA: glycosyltransferase [Thermodesulfovibrionia bacterium]|nr:glycosyltransferase [Thermodesulfovibrionia bacterium]
MKEKKYKVLFLTSWYPDRFNPINGVFIQRHAEAIAQLCYVIIVYVKKDSELHGKIYDIEYTSEHNRLTVKVYYKGSGFRMPVVPLMLNFIRYIKASYLALSLIKNKFKEPCPYIIHVNVTVPAGILALILRKIKGIPYILTEHYSVFLSPSLRQQSIYNRFLTKMIVKHASIVTVVSMTLRDAMLRQGLKNTYHIIPNVVDMAPCTGAMKEDSQKKRILHVSLLDDSVKNVSGLIKAMSNIIPIRDDCALHIVGDGPDREMLEDLSKQLNLYKRYVFFHGLKSKREVREFMEAASFFVLNSHFETFSVATAESIACGTPVIATKCGGPEEFVTHDCGLLIEKGDQKELEAAILYMLDNYNTYDK